MPREYKVRTPSKMRPPHPGAILKLDILPALGVTVTEAARDLGISRQMLHNILAERHPVSADMAVRLGLWCGNGGYLWLALQRDFDLWQAERAAKSLDVPRRRAA
jgi:addiction module HigA family antidote